MKIVLDITSCKGCPFFEQKRHYTADSFEHVNDWLCKKKNGKKIAGCVDWHEEDKVAVPDWCPIKADK